MTDIQTVRLLSGNNEIDNQVIEFFLESTKQFILAYCNITEIPEGLKPTYLEITSLRVKANTSGASVALGEGLKIVGSISDGNQSIGYAAGASGGKTFVSEEDLVTAYGYMLDSFRKMKTSRSCGVLRARGSRCLHRHGNDTGW